MTTYKLILSILIACEFSTVIECIPIDNGLVAKAVTSEAKTTVVCDVAAAADFVTIIDGSSSIGEDNFKKLAKWLGDLADEFPDDSRFGVIEFSSIPVKLWNLDTYDMKADVVDAFNNMRYLTGTTRTAAALQFAIDKDVLTQGNRPEVPDILTVITDGQASDKPIPIAEKIRALGWQVYAIGIGNANKAELEGITGNRSNSVLILKTFDDLTPEVRQQLVQQQVTCQTITLESKAIGEASIQLECRPDSIYVGGDTQNPFEGNVYVKNQYSDPECKSEGNGIESRAELTMATGTCGTVRRRSIDPPGVYLENTVVFSFHKKFVTKVDRAYRVQCFYMEADKTVDTDLDVSKLTTQAEEQQFPMPTCQYTIHRESPDGPPVRFALVGEATFHKWECDDSNSGDLFKMKVHSCQLLDVNGDPIELLDENGCTVDKNILNNPEYTEGRLLATVESHAFRLRDQAGEQFQCQVELCVNLEDKRKQKMEKYYETHAVHMNEMSTYLLCSVRRKRDTIRIDVRSLCLVHTLIAQIIATLTRPPVCPDPDRAKRSVAEQLIKRNTTKHLREPSVVLLNNDQLRRSQPVMSDYIEVASPADLGFSDFESLKPIYYEALSNVPQKDEPSQNYCVSSSIFSVFLCSVVALIIIVTALMVYLARRQVGPIEVKLGVKEPFKM